MMCSFSLKKSVIADRQSWKHLINITHTAHSCVLNNPLRGVVGQHTAADGLFLKWDSAVPMWLFSVTADIRLYLGVRWSICTQIIRRLWCGASAAVQLWRWKVRHCDTGGFVCDSYMSCVTFHSQFCGKSVRLQCRLRWWRLPRSCCKTFELPPQSVVKRRNKINKFICGCKLIL